MGEDLHTDVADRIAADRLRHTIQAHIVVNIIPPTPPILNITRAICPLGQTPLRKHDRPEQPRDAREEREAQLALLRRAVVRDREAAWGRRDDVARAGPLRN